MSCADFDGPGDAPSLAGENGIAGATSGLSATYFDNANFTGTTVERIDPIIDFNWGRGSPDPAIGADAFSVRWTGFVEAEHSETYTFYTVSDDGIRLKVNGEIVIDNWTNHGPTENRGTIDLVAGRRYPLELEFFENRGGAVAKLLWSSSKVTKQTIPENRLFNRNSGEDLCPDDLDKTGPGECGCGTPDIDSDGDGTADCKDGCIDDQKKTKPGICGCGTPDIDSDGNGVLDCKEEEHPSYQCNIVCTGGKVLSDSCQASMATPGEGACDQRKEACCVGDVTRCPSLCDGGEVFDNEAYLHVNGVSCGDYMASLTPTAPGCVDPLPHIPDACCKTGLPSSPPVASTPCYDLCGDDLQMVGSRVLEDYFMTCFDYARSISADEPQCTTRDPAIVDKCCDSPRPIPTDNFGNYCCLCGGCYGATGQRQHLTIGPENETCVALDYHMTVGLKKSDAECTARKEAFSATCCDASFEAPPPVPAPAKSLNPCTLPGASASFCSAGSFSKCNLCKDGSYPKRPYSVATIANVPGNPTCADLHWMGLYKKIPAEICYPIQSFLAEPCGCN